jgi:hypothetical protein
MAHSSSKMALLSSKALVFSTTTIALYMFNAHCDRVLVESVIHASALRVLRHTNRRMNRTPEVERDVGSLLGGDKDVEENKVVTGNQNRVNQRLGHLNQRLGHLNQRQGHVNTQRQRLRHHNPVEARSVEDVILENELVADGIDSLEDSVVAEKEEEFSQWTMNPEGHNGSRGSVLPMRRFFDRVKLDRRRSNLRGKKMLEVEVSDGTWTYAGAVKVVGGKDLEEKRSVVYHFLRNTESVFSRDKLK